MQAGGAAEAWGAGRDDEFWRAASPWQQLNLPQIRVLDGMNWERDGESPIICVIAQGTRPGRSRYSGRKSADGPG